MEPIEQLKARLAALEKQIAEECSRDHGILAHVENSKLTSKVERCDLCCRYQRDEEAHKVLEEKLCQ
jgi:hypothetical protein